MIVPVGIALGSNLGDREAELEAGFRFLSALSENGAFEASRKIETAPVGCAPGTPPFLNAVVVMEIDSAAISPRDLLFRLQEFEVSRGRDAEREPNAPRPLDLDIVFYGDLMLHEPGLEVPHARALKRLFVLKPLAEVRPDLILPGQDKTVSELLHRVTRDSHHPPSSEAERSGVEGPCRDERQTGEAR